MHYRDKYVATDTIYSDSPSIDDGSTCAQLFVGAKSLVSDVYGMKIDKQFVNTLEHNIRSRGAMSKLIGYHDQSDDRNRAHTILWALFIDDMEN